jgi:nucleoside-diphosphate-sugar epimerase
MNILIIGGTKFIGPYVVKLLLKMGHEVTVFHRGINRASLPSEVKQIFGNRDQIASYKREFQNLAPDVVLDMIAYNQHDAQSVVDLFQNIASRVVAISSQDVYRARDILWKRETCVIEQTPLSESAQLRSKFFLFQNLPDFQEEDIPADYEKILVEQAYMCNSNLPATILRLPMVYGPGDYRHRFYPYLQRMEENRPAIVLEESIAQWQGSYSYVENVASAISLAVTNEKAAGRIYNVSEVSGFSEANLIQTIGYITGWQGKVEVVPKSKLPSDWEFPFNTKQHWITDSTRIRQELDYLEHIDREEGLKRTIIWERLHPPKNFSSEDQPGLLNYASEDIILAALGLL